MEELKLVINGEELDGSYVSLIRNQHTYLCGLRDSRKEPSQQLLEDIAVYEFILKHDNPDRAANSYFEARTDFTEPKITVARKLGWEITVNGGSSR